jgi:membrane protein DedA with SNARE-associated domain
VSISHLIETYGHLAVFLLVGAESLGIPLPGETALSLAGTFAGHAHRLSPWLIFLVAVAAPSSATGSGTRAATGWPGGTGPRSG